MGTWNTPAQVPVPPSYSQAQTPTTELINQALQVLYDYIKQVANVISSHKNDLEFMLNGTLDANNIRANSITANKMNVDELSAISANLGHITAGLIDAVQIFGSYIATANGTYPRCEMSAADNLFGAYGTATRFIKIIPDTSGIPIMEVTNGSMRGFLQPLLSEMLLSTSVGSGNIGISSGLDLILHAQGQTKVDSWTKLYSSGDAQTMQSALNSKANSFSGYTGSFSTGTQTVTVSNGIITSVV